MNYSEANIQIESIELLKSGLITITGTAEGVPLEYSLDSGLKEFEKFLPKEPEDFEYIDSEGLLNVTQDDYFNAHWHVKIGGQVLSKQVHMEDIAKEVLLEEYQKSR